MTPGRRLQSVAAVEWIRGRNRNWSAVAWGSTTTVLLTAALFALPLLAPADPVKDAVFASTGEWLHGNPYVGLRYWGGVGGGAVAGALSKGPTGYDDWASAVTSGVKAAVYGLVFLYLCYVGAVLAVDLFVTDVFGLSLLVIFPLVIAIPLFASHLVGGILGALVGNAASRVADGKQLV